jgi:hypothetical protein
MARPACTPGFIAFKSRQTVNSKALSCIDYDAESRIVSLNGQPTYLHDAEGRRVAKYSGSTTTAYYLLDLVGNQVTEGSI